MAKKLTKAEQMRLLMVQIRLDPSSTLTPYSQWCHERHPSAEGYVCSRKKYHSGPHFAQQDEDDPEICPVEPNPWW